MLIKVKSGQYVNLPRSISPTKTANKLAINIKNCNTFILIAILNIDVFIRHFQRFNIRKYGFRVSFKCYNFYSVNQII